MEYTDIRYSDITTCIDSVSARAAQLEDGCVSKWIVWGEQSHAYIIKHPIETQWLLAMEYTDIRYSDITTCIDSVSARAAQLETDGLQMNCVGESSLMLHNQNTQLNTIDFLRWNTLTSGTWHYYVYWFCECQSWRTGDDGLQMHCVRRAVSCLHNQAPNWNTIDSLWWNTLTSGTVTLLRVWFCECQRQHTGGRMVSKWIVWGEQSHAYIIKHPIETQLTPCDGIHWHQYSNIPTCIDSVSARAAQLEDGWSPNEFVWESSLMLHNQAPNLNTMTPCDGIHSHQYSDITTCIDSVSARAAQLEDGWSPNECMRRASHAYIIKHPIETQLTPCDGIHWHQVQWHSYVYWFCECQSSTTGGWMVSKWIVWGRAVYAYIIKHPIETQLTPCDGIHSHQVQYITTCIDSVSARAAHWRTDGLQRIVWGRAVSCLHNQAPNWNTIDFLRWNYTDIRYSDITTCIDSVSARAAQLRTDGLKWIVWGEQSHAT